MFYEKSGFAPHSIVTANTGAAGIYENRYKRRFDFVVTIALLTLLSPLLVPMLAAVLALVSLDGHPPIYRQKRIGQHGQIFGMLKIRTMVPDADRALVRHLASQPAARAEWGRCQKLRDDPRVTPLGRVLRQTSLDELPQLWNVLRGEMSLVGPRPIMVDQASLYPGTAYYALRPGLTGLWQVSARNASSFVERARYDELYRASITLSGDVMILLRTIGVVLRGTGW